MISYFDFDIVLDNLNKLLSDMTYDDVKDVFNYLHPKYTTNVFYKNLILEYIEDILYNTFDTAKESAILLLLFKLHSLNIYDNRTLLYNVYFSDIYRFEYITNNNINIIDNDFINKEYLNIYDLKEGDKINIYNNDNDLIITLNISKTKYSTGDIRFLGTIRILFKGYITVEDINNCLIKLNINFDILEKEIIKGNIRYNINFYRPGYFYLDDDNDKYQLINIIKNDSLNDLIDYCNKNKNIDYEFIVDYTQFYKAVKCFKYLMISDIIKTTPSLLNERNEFSSTEFLVKGGSIEMFKLIEEIGINYYNVLIEIITYNRFEWFEYCFYKLDKLHEKELFYIINCLLKKYKTDLIELVINEYEDLFNIDSFITYKNHSEHELIIFTDIIIFDKINKDYTSLLIKNYLINTLNYKDYYDDYYEDNQIDKEFITEEMIKFIKSIDETSFENYKYIIILHLLRLCDISLSLLKKYLLLMCGTTDNYIIYNILSDKICKNKKIEIKNQQYMKQILMNLFNNNFIDNHDYEKYEILKYLLSPVEINNINISDVHHDKITNYKIYLYLSDIFKITFTNEQINSILCYFIWDFIIYKNCITETDLNYINDCFNTFINLSKKNINDKYFIFNFNCNIDLSHRLFGKYFSHKNINNEIAKLITRQYFNTYNFRDGSGYRYNFKIKIERAITNQLYYKNYEVINYIINECNKLNIKINEKNIFINEILKL